MSLWCNSGPRVIWSNFSVEVEKKNFFYWGSHFLSAFSKLKYPLLCRWSFVKLRQWKADFLLLKTPLSSPHLSLDSSFKKRVDQKNLHCSGWFAANRITKLTTNYLRFLKKYQQTCKKVLSGPVLLVQIVAPNLFARRKKRHVMI
jgi:hypothetical protein